MEERGAKVILVTSTAPGEGKSVLSQNLAESFAYWGKKVVLLDGDLRRPVLYQRFGHKRERMSLEDVLSGCADMDTVIRRHWDRKLTAVLNSVPVDKPTVLIDSTAMKQMVESFAKRADLVIIDTPPCGQLSDVSLYQQYADGILYVVQQDRLAIRQIVDAAASLNESENKLLGYVLNGAQQISQGYGKYGYGQYSYGKYGGYGKYGYGRYGKCGSYVETEHRDKVSER
jgi:capsular exopolysaccharide synthesis family protein